MVAHQRDDPCPRESHERDLLALIGFRVLLLVVSVPVDPIHSGDLDTLVDAAVLGPDQRSCIDQRPRRRPSAEGTICGMKPRCVVVTSVKKSETPASKASGFEVVKGNPSNRVLSVKTVRRRVHCFVSRDRKYCDFSFVTAA